MFRDLPIGILTCTVWTYWTCVAFMVTRSWVRFGKPAGAIPETFKERLIWAIWIPNWIGWMVLPYLASTSSGPLIGLPHFAQEPLMLAIRGTGAAIAVLSLLGTIPCWLGMGANWSMAVVPSKTTELVTTGPFGLVRHPIYSLNLLLMTMSVVVAATPLMILVGLIHVTLINAKASNEERYLHKLHGQAYAEYCRQTDRFLPLRLARR